MNHEVSQRRPDEGQEPIKRTRGRVFSLGRLALLCIGAAYGMTLFSSFLFPNYGFLFYDSDFSRRFIIYAAIAMFLGALSPVLAFGAILRYRSRIDAILGSLVLILCLQPLFFEFPAEMLASSTQVALNMIIDPLPKGIAENHTMTMIFKHLYEAAQKDPEKRFARLSKTPGRLMHEMEDAAYPNEDFICYAYISLKHPNYKQVRKTADRYTIVDDWSYFYLGYEIANDDDMEAFADAYRRTIASGDGFDHDLKVAEGKGKNGSGSLPRLSLKPPPLPADAVRPPLPADFGAHIPVLIERIRKKSGEGGNVLFLDGHYEFIEYPGRWPMTPRTVQCLEELDGLGNRPQEGRQTP